MKTKYKVYIGIGIVLLLGMLIVNLASPSENEEIEEIDEGIIETLHTSLGTMVKLNECANLCAGEDKDIPVIKNECYSACYQIYYYLGIEELNEYVEDME